MQMLLFSAAGVHNPQMGLTHIQMSAHQREHPSEHHTVQGLAIGIDELSARGLVVGVSTELSAHHTNGPVLKRLSHRGNGMVAHWY